MLYPLTFEPILKERVWGGRELERLFGKRLPGKGPIGESWEIADRPGDHSVVAHGPLAGRSLRWLMENHQAELLGDAPAPHGVFPLLIKILDAREKLSLQVHPPADLAARLGGEPKTEMWYVADAAAGAELYAGLRKGVTKDQFAAKIQSGGVEECFHRIPVQAGDSMFLPSGRVHAIGAGLVILEVQQNSDTTYRVFDWNRQGLDGKPRELHVEQSLASINFNDFEPRLVRSDFMEAGGRLVKPLVRHQLFCADVCQLNLGSAVPLVPGRMQILGLVSGDLRVEHPTGALHMKPGDFVLVPASAGAVRAATAQAATVLRVEAGRGPAGAKSPPALPRPA